VTADRDESTPLLHCPRCEPLPGETPKPAEDDPGAPERVQRILRSPAYVQADQDPALLQLDGLRGTRLALEYLKAELTLAEQEVESTIVLFGSTRIVEPAAAQRAVHTCEALCAAAPDDPVARRKLAVARRILAKSKYYEVARTFARLVSESCRQHPREFVIMTGGGPGIMEAGNRGAHEAGAPSVGLNITLPLEQFPNPYISPELCMRFRYFALRKLHFMKRAKALVAFPGGYGTLDELGDALCLVQTRKIPPMPIVLVGREFWQRALDLRFLADEGVIAEEDMALVSYAESADEIWLAVRSFYGT
jgi:uncharacterized protein (TIGR00730 family)